MKWLSAFAVLALGLAALLLPAPAQPEPGDVPGIVVPPLAVCPTDESSSRSTGLHVVSTVSGVGRLTIFSGGGSAGTGTFETGTSGSASVAIADVAAVGEAAALVEFPASESATAAVTVGQGLISGEVCSRIPDTQVIIGGGSTVEDRPLEVRLMNPYSATAEADITAFSESGRESNDALRSIVVPPRSSVSVDIGSILPGRASLNLVVATTRGNLVTTAATEIGGDQAVWRAVAPEETWYLPAPVFAGTREIVLASSTPADIPFQIDVFGPDGVEEAAIEGTVAGGGQTSVDLSQISPAALAVRVVATDPIAVFERLTSASGIGMASASPLAVSNWLLPGAGSESDASSRVVLVNAGVESAEITITELRADSRSRRITLEAGRVIEVELDQLGSDGVSISSDGEIVPLWMAIRAGAVAISGGFPLQADDY